MNFRTNLFPFRQYLQVPNDIIRGGRLWIHAGRYRIARPLGGGRHLIHLGEHELTIVNDKESILE